VATPTLSRHRLPGALGEILVDVRAAARSSARPAVIVLHGFKGFKDWGMFPVLAERLARAGFAAVSLNVSGSGVDQAGEFADPERFGHNTFSAELADLAAVTDALVRGELDVVAPTAVGLIGHSRGGGVAVLETARDRRIRALATWASIGSVERWPRAEWPAWRARGRIDVVNARTGQVLPLYPDGLDDIERNAAALAVEAAASRIAVPWLIVHGTADEAVDVREARLLAAASGRETTELVEIRGAGHTFGARHPWAGSTDALDEAMDRTLAWFTRHLGG
jgi:dienelactone hydrolase